MKSWSRMHTFIADSALILITNAFAVAGVVYNRSGTPESVTSLTSRELTQPYNWHANSEDSGIALHLRTRTVKNGSPFSEGFFEMLPDEYSNNLIIDKAKLAALGFNVSVPEADLHANEFYDHQLPRDALLVLEIDGSAYQKALKAAREIAAHATARMATQPENSDLIEAAEEARRYLEREEYQNSRLFVIDAGLDLARLRSQYTNRAKYLIVRGQVSIGLTGREKRKRPILIGHVHSISCNRITVPATYRELFSHIKPHRFDRIDKQPQYTVNLAYGQRLEPWIISINPYPNGDVSKLIPRAD